MNYEQAMTGAELAGTERRTKRVPFYAKIVTSVAAVLAVLWIIFYPGAPLSALMTYKAEAKLEAAARAREAATKAGSEVLAVAKPVGGILELGPNETSRRLPVPYLHHVNFGGKNFEVHCVYGDGRDLVAPCPSGDMESAYVVNTRGTPNAVTWQYEARKK